MDASAIQEIQKSADVIASQKAVDDAAFAVPHIAMASGTHLVDVEAHMAHRTFMRGTMETNSMDAFFAYCEKHASKESACFMALLKFKWVSKIY